MGASVKDDECEGTVLLMAESTRENSDEDRAGAAGPAADASVASVGVSTKFVTCERGVESESRTSDSRDSMEGGAGGEGERSWAVEACGGEGG